MKGSIALVLHAHLPFVRRPDYPEYYEERWLFEAITETYLPLLRVFKRLEDEGLPFRLAMVLSPTLLCMVQDELLKGRYDAYLERQLSLAEGEAARTSGDPGLAAAAEVHRSLYQDAKRDWNEAWQKDLPRAFDHFARRGQLELLATAATHAFLPFYTLYPEAINAQIEIAARQFHQVFGRQPQGFWLPELGYAPGLEVPLRQYNFSYTIAATHGLLFGEPAPLRGSYAPVARPDGFAIFARDIAASKALISREEGYPSDPAYRDFQRDIGHELPLDYIGPHVLEGGLRIPTGFKYWAIGEGGREDRPVYDPARARARAGEQAAAFLDARAAQLEAAREVIDRPPLALAPWDAELFGHFWFEGPIWLEALFRQAALRDDVELIAPADYLRRHDAHQEVAPELSSWGTNGYGETWLDAKNDWVYRHTHKAIERMIELAERFPNESGLKERALNQAAREVLLSQCSDWTVMMKNDSANPFGRRQVEDHVAHFTQIYESLSCNGINTEWLTRLEKRDNLFPALNYRIFRKKV